MAGPSMTSGFPHQFSAVLTGSPQGVRGIELVDDRRQHAVDVRINRNQSNTP
jgi:hypothetical protein